MRPYRTARASETTSTRLRAGPAERCRTRRRSRARGVDVVDEHDRRRRAAGGREDAANVAAAVGEPAPGLPLAAARAAEQRRDRQLPELAERSGQGGRRRVPAFASTLGVGGDDTRAHPPAAAPPSRRRARPRPLSGRGGRAPSRRPRACARARRRRSPHGRARSRSAGPRTLCSAAPARRRANRSVRRTAARAGSAPRGSRSQSRLAGRLADGAAAWQEQREHPTDGRPSIRTRVCLVRVELVRVSLGQAGPAAEPVVGLEQLLVVADVVPAALEFVGVDRLALRGANATRWPGWSAGLPSAR